MIGGTNFNQISNNFWSPFNSGFMNMNQNLLAGFQPLFGVNLANTPQSFRSSVMDVRRGAEDLRTSLRNMVGTGRNVSSPFGAFRPVSGNTERMGITRFDGNRLRNANVESFTVDINQVARAQRNEGAALTAADLAVNSGFTAGANSLSINVGGSQFDFNFNISATDTVRDVQQRIASAINSRNIGVTASVSFDSATGESALNLQSAATGVRASGQPNFTVSGSGTIAGDLGVTTITQAAQNAEFRVNRTFNGREFIGALQTSRSNDVDLGHGIFAELRDTGRVNVNMTRDEGAQISSFRDVVNSFNALMRTAQRDANANAGFNAHNRSASRLERDLIGVFNTYSHTLARVGVTMNRDGLLQIDEDQMRTAAAWGDLERLVFDGNRSNFGFVRRLEQTAGNIIRNPGNFVSNHQFNPRFNSQMNRFMSVGILFNALF